MKLSVMLFPFHRQLTEGSRTADSVLVDFGGAGVTGIEPMLGWIDSEPAKWETFRKATVNAGMTFPCLDIGVDLVGSSASDRASALDTVARGVDYARTILDCPTVLLAGSRAADGMSEEEGRRIYGDTLAEAARRAQVRLGHGAPFRSTDSIITTPSGEDLSPREAEPVSPDPRRPWQG